MEEQESNLRLQIKTLNQKIIIIDITENKTVLDLKKELCYYPDVGVGPEKQRLIYAGQIMANDQLLSSYDIDTRKCLIVMKGRPEAIDVADGNQRSLESSCSSSTSSLEKDNSSKISNPIDNVSNEVGKEVYETEPLVQKIVAMGYDEKEVRKALAASFNNAERAIEYLIDGIPSSGSEVDSNTELQERNARLSRYINDRHFRSLRNAIRDNPEDADGTLEVLGYENPALLRVITENQEDFLEFMLDDDISSGDEITRPEDY